MGQFDLIGISIVCTVETIPDGLLFRSHLNISIRLESLSLLMMLIFDTLSVTSKSYSK